MTTHALTDQPPKGGGHMYQVIVEDLAKGMPDPNDPTSGWVPSAAPGADPNSDLKTILDELKQLKADQEAKAQAALERKQLLEEIASLKGSTEEAAPVVAAAASTALTSEQEREALLAQIEALKNAGVDVSGLSDLAAAATSGADPGKEGYTVGGPS